MDPFADFKDAQRKGWSHFAPLELQTTPPAAQLVRHAGVKAGQRVLDVGCGTGVAAISAARLGARVVGLDLTPALLERARENARIAGVDIEWHEGDAEQLPFPDGSFDVVISQFGHIFAPRPDVTVSEMLRVLRSGGTIAFNTWPPELFTGRMFVLTGKYAPPPPPGVTPPVLWGDPNVIRERFGERVSNIGFHRAEMLVPALSPQHHREIMERTAGPVIRMIETLGTAAPERLASFRAEYEALVAEYLQDNVVHQGYLLTRATKL
ncbi:MAG: class I SAM-dependent methyltransferase [Vicinamibacterales bacterium]